MPMHSRNNLQKKETSAPIPKKYLEYEVSQRRAVREPTDQNHLPWPGKTVVTYMSYHNNKRSW